MCIVCMVCMWPMHACTVRARHPPRQGHVSQRKLFFGGLGPETTDASLLKAAVRYGKVQEAVVVRTDGGKSRGFGFVTCARATHWGQLHWGQLHWG